MREKIKEVILTIWLPLTYLSALWLKFGLTRKRLQINDQIFSNLGIFPILDNYYEPLVNPRKHLKKNLRNDRILRGINWNIDKQLDILHQFNFQEELKKIPLEKQNNTEYFYNNNMYATGDSEYLYCMVRLFKPRKIIEIGSGNSILMTINAIKKNELENTEYKCHHLCIEPYEQPWLEKVQIELRREKVEDIELSVFNTLGENDLLFIDSSHIIRPQGDVLFEILEILPSLKPRVLIHIHDIFTPKDYLNEWIFQDKKLWNEQYLLEAFLSFNKSFEIIGAINYLSHNYRELFEKKFPIYKSEYGREPGAFWIRRIT